MRPSPAVLLVLALSLAGCTEGSRSDDSSAAPTSDEPTSSPGTSSSPTPPAPGAPSATASGSPGAASPGQVPRPAPGSCEPVARSADGRYVIADAGEVTLRLEDGSVQVDVSSSDGWATTTASTPIMAVVSFTRGDEALALEAEREAGRLVIRICDDAD